MNFMTFGDALLELRLGKKVARKGWNGKGMFIYLVSGTTIPYTQLRGEAATHVKSDKGPWDDKVVINPHIDMKVADGIIVVGWLASQTDMLAGDWMVVE